jgi:hypothetical protein
MVLVTHPAHPFARRPRVEVSELAACHLLVREQGSMTREATESALRAVGEELPAHTVIGSREAICEAIRHNLGASVMPMGEVPRDPALTVVPFASRAPVIHEYLYCLNSRRETRLLSALLDSLVTAWRRLRPPLRSAAASAYIELIRPSSKRPPPQTPPIDDRPGRPSFPEYDQLLALLELGAPWFRSKIACEVTVQGHSFAVHVASLGTDAPDAPAIGIFGGIHGLERIGTQLVLDYMRSVLCRLAWDDLLHRQLADGAAGLHADRQSRRDVRGHAPIRTVST